jgi:phage-related minor tail protein
MNLERAAMKGKLAEAEQQRERLKLKIQGAATALRQGLNTALTPVEDLEVPALAEQMDNLVMAWAELQKCLSDISRLERELR